MKVIFFVVSLAFAFTIDTNAKKLVFANNGEDGKPNSYVDFYKNFYDQERNHERKMTILEKCKEIMPVS